MQVNVEYVTFVSFETSSCFFCFKREYMTDIGTTIRPNISFLHIYCILEGCVHNIPVEYNTTRGLL